MKRWQLWYAIKHPITNPKKKTYSKRSSTSSRSFCSTRVRCLPTASGRRTATLLRWWRWSGLALDVFVEPRAPFSASSREIFIPFGITVARSIVARFCAGSLDLFFFVPASFCPESKQCRNTVWTGLSNCGHCWQIKLSARPAVSYSLFWIAAVRVLAVWLSRAEFASFPCGLPRSPALRVAAFLPFAMTALAFGAWLLLQTAVISA